MKQIFSGAPSYAKEEGATSNWVFLKRLSRWGMFYCKSFFILTQTVSVWKSTSSSFPLLQKLEMADRKQHMPTLRALLLHSIPLPCHPPTRLAPLPPGHMARPRDVGRTLQLDLDLPQPQPWTLQVTVQVAFLI